MSLRLIKPLGSVLLALAAGLLPAASGASAPDVHRVSFLPGRGEAHVQFTPGGDGEAGEHTFTSGDDHHAYRVEPGNSYLFPESHWDRFTGNRSGPFVIEVITREDESVWASGIQVSRTSTGAAGFTLSRFEGSQADRGLGLYVISRKAAEDGSFPAPPVWAAEGLDRSLQVLEGLFGALPSRRPRVMTIDFPRPIAKSLPGALFLDRRLVDRNGPPPASRIAVLAHEAAHLWWPNHVRSQGPGASLLHEGMAEFGATQVVASVLGEAAAEARWQALRDEYMAASEAILVAGASLVDPGTGQDFGRALRYARAAWVVRMMALRAGRQGFVAAMEGIVGDRWPFSWQGMAEALTSTTGADFHTFHQQWVASAGHPNIAIHRLAGEPPVLANGGGGGGVVPVATVCGERVVHEAWVAVPAGGELRWQNPVADGCGLVVDRKRHWLVGARGPRAAPGLTLGRAWGFPVVTAVTDGSPADTAGLRQGDLIVAVDGQPQDEERVQALVRRLRSGNDVLLRVRRGRNELEIRFQPPSG